MKRRLIGTAFTLVLLSGAVYGQDLRSQAVVEQTVPLPLCHVNAVKAAKKLSALLGDDANILADEWSNTVFIRASADKTQKATKTLRLWDVPSCCHVIRLKKTDANEVATMLRLAVALLTGLDDDREAHIVADERGNSIIVVASEAKINKVRGILGWLDLIAEPR
jgi:type II secretory pathway component GspD/PulD (secretin)